MKSYYFSEFPYHEYPDEEGDKYPSLRLTFPNSWFEPTTANELFKRYFDECVYADVGFHNAQRAHHAVEYPDEEGDKYPSLRLTFPNSRTHHRQRAVQTLF